MRYREIICEDGLIVQGVNTTADVKPGEIRRQAAKMGMTVSDNGIPPLISKDSVIKEMPSVAEDEQESPLDPRQVSPLTNRASAAHRKAVPGTEGWFKAWFARPYLTGER